MKQPVTPSSHLYPDARILVVDDEPLFLAYLKKILSEAGYLHPEFESDPVVALKRLQNESFDLLLLDQNMPHMSGLDLLEAISQLPQERQIPAMMLTADDDRESRHKALGLGALDFLTKPFDVIEVTTRIRNILQVRMLHNELEGMNQSLEQTVKDRTKQLQREVNERKRIEEQLEYLGATDMQTGLPSGMIFMDRLQQMLLRNSKKHIGTVLVGLHVFWVEDMAERDDWKREFAQLLTETLPRASIMRDKQLGYMILHSVKDQEALETLIQKIEQLQEGGEFGFKLGYVVDWIGELEPEQMVQRAHENLSAEKREDQQPTSMKAHLHRVIFDHCCADFELAWQPQVLLSGERLVGAEVLLRWNSSELGFVSPAKIIEIAEQEGWIGRITHWLIETAISQYRNWVDQGLQLDHFSLNLSAQDLLGSDCLQQIKQQLEKYDIPPERLCVELTESKLVENISEARKVLQELQEMGVKVALDDFGTGYSSLSYLKLFPIDILKIDRSFAVNLMEDDVSQAIIQAMTQLAQHLKMAVVVEGVEYAEQIEMLKQSNVDLIQGYFYSKPLPPAEFMDYYNKILH